MHSNKLTVYLLNPGEEAFWVAECPCVLPVDGCQRAEGWEVPLVLTAAAVVVLSAVVVGLAAAVAVAVVQTTVAVG